MKDIYHLIFDKVLELTDDGFIVVDTEGIVININEQYADFLKTTPEKAIGHSIFDIIPNSKMLDIVKNKYSEEAAVHEYLKGTSKEEKVIVSRSYVENELGEVIAGVAQVKFRLQSLDVAQILMEEYSTLSYYKEQNSALKEKHYGFNDMIGSDEAFVEQKKEGMRIAKTDFSVLITGETGTGKELFAAGIHNNSHRADKPMISINCAAIPGELLETELFGYEEGAFTGAKKGGKKGKFEMANKGTLFLDEIGDMPLWMQAKLLRVLQEREVEPVGGLESIPIDIRIIAATRRDLTKMIDDGSFREDLYYRLNVVNMEMIPLRRRRSDIMELAEYFLEELNSGYKTAKVFDAKVRRSFKQYNWPGNIRELSNVVKSAYASSMGKKIGISNLPSKMAQGYDAADQTQGETLKDRVENYEKRQIQELMEKHRWHFQTAAKEAGIHRSILYKKVAKYGLKKHENPEN